MRGFSSDLLKTKTFWVGVLAIGSAVVGAIFSGPADSPAGVGAALQSLLFGPHSAALLIGLAAVTGRQAVLDAASGR